MTLDRTPSTSLERTEPDTLLDRLLSAMLLHAITVMYGEAGLRQRLVLKVARFPADGRARAEAALELATRLHAGDRRRREPYINHPLRAAIRILSHYQVSDLDVVCAALLRDTAEDHSDDLAPGGTRQDAVVVLAGQFGERTGQLVAAVTNPVWESGRSTREQYRDHVIVSLETSPWARVIKLSDFTDNAVGLIHTSGPKLAALARKYHPMAPIMREFALRDDAPPTLRPRSTSHRRSRRHRDKTTREALHRLSDLLGDGRQAVGTPAKPRSLGSLQDISVASPAPSSSPPHRTENTAGPIGNMRLIQRLDTRPPSPEASIEDVSNKL